MVKSIFHEVTAFLRNQSCDVKAMHICAVNIYVQKTLRHTASSCGDIQHGGMKQCRVEGVTFSPDLCKVGHVICLVCAC